MQRDQVQLKVYQDGRCVDTSLHRDTVGARLAARRYIHRDPAQQVFRLEVLDLRLDVGQQVVWSYGGEQS